jgi:mono/diheme cytochrome c family protein
LLLVGLPFFDRSLERRPWKRPISVGLFTAVLLGLAALGVISHREDIRNPGVAAQLQAQREATKAFMNAKFEPELSGGSLAAENKALANPEAAKGKEIFEGQACNACHGDNGVGTAAAPKLIGIGAKYDAAKLQALLLHPTAKMTAGGMPTPDLKDDEMKQLIAYLQSLK